MNTLLLTEIDWDTRRFLANSLPRQVLIVGVPDDVDSDDLRFQDFLKRRFGRNTIGFVAYGLPQIKQMVGKAAFDVKMVVWE